MFKHSLLTLALAGLMCAASAVAQNAPDQQQPSAEPMHHGHGPMMDPAQRTAHLTKKLNLNADQQAKVQDIFKSEQSQMESLHNDSSMSRQDRRAKMMDIRKASNDQVRALLDGTQQKKWDEMQAQREQQWQGRHKGGTPPEGDEQ